MQKFRKLILSTSLSIIFINFSYAEGGSDSNVPCVSTGQGLTNEIVKPAVGNPYCMVSITDKVMDKINQAKVGSDTAQNTADSAINIANDALSKASKNKTTNSAGNNIKVNSTTNADGSTNYEITTADDVNFNGVNSNHLQSGSVTIDKQSTDIDGHTIIHGLGNGKVEAESNDAINGGQLWQVQQAAQEAATKAKTTISSGNNIKINSSTNADGSTNYEVSTADDINLNSITSNNIQVGSVLVDRQKADTNGHTIIQGVGNGLVSNGSTEVVNGGQLWQVQQAAQEAATKAKTTISSGNNIKINSSTNADGSTNYEVSTADDINLNSITSNNIQVGSVLVDRQKADTNGHTIIQGVGNGLVSNGSTEVVNGGQLWQVQQDTNNEINRIKTGQAGLVLTDGKTTTIDKSGTSTVINISGANGDRVLTGVANGVNPNDAVNVSQLREYQNQNSTHLNALNNKIERNRKVSSQGIASVAAMSIEYPEQEPGHVATGFGFGTYDGENAIGWGINYLATTGKTKLYGGVAQAFGSSTRAVGKIGLSFVF